MNFQCPSPNDNDDIHYVIVNTGYENNMFNTYDDSLSGLMRFNINNKCKCLFVYTNNDIYIADYDKDDWSKNTYTEKEYNLTLGILNYLKEDKSFIVFELVCERGYEEALRLISNMQDLDICRIWTCDFIDIKNLREKYKSVYASYDAEAG